MIKKYLICLTFISIAVQLNVSAQPTGNPYEDAQTFLKGVQAGATTTDIDGLASIVSYYCDSSSINAGNVGVALKKMPFLDKYALRVNDSLARLSSGPSSSAVPTGGGASALPGLGTNIIDGIAKFLIERGKQELSMVFFDRFREDLKKFPELTFLFPSTTEIIKNIESHNFHTLLQELKDAFMKDLSTMPDNILSLRNINNGLCNGNTACVGRVNFINAAFTTTPAYDSRLLILPLIVMQGVLDGDNIIEISNKLCADASVCSNGDNLSGFIQITSILLESLRTIDNTGGAFLNHAEIKNLFYSRDLLNVFLGLIYQKYNTPGFTCYNSLRIGGQNMQGVFTAVLNGRAKFYSTLSSFDKINSSYTALQKNIKDGGKADAAHYAAAVSSSISMFTNITNSLESLLPGSLPAATLIMIRTNLDITNNICNDIQQKNYAGIFNSTIRILQENNIIEAGTGREKVIKYLAFAANLASAKTSDEVKEAINTVALPPGSYSIKQKSSFNVSLNGYIGYNWDFNGGLYASGVYAPVGFSASRGLGKKHGGALTLFASVIDVGAVVSYRLKNGTTDDLKQVIRLESVLAPSAQLFFEIPKTPIAFGPGWRRTSKLFFSDDTDFSVVKSKSVFSVSVLIDIPIITLKNTLYK